MDHMGKEMALVEQSDNKPSSVNLIYSLSEEIGALAESLKIFQKYKVNLLHIESRSSTRLPGYEFIVELDQQKGEVAGALEEIKNASRYCQIITSFYKDNKDTVPWFPSKIQDLDRFANQILSYGSESSSFSVSRPSSTEEGFSLYRNQSCHCHSACTV